MAKIRFLFKSHPDDVTLTATSGTPSRMQAGGPSRTWRSNSTVEQTVTAPFSESKNIDVIHLENINTSEVLVVQFSDDNFATIKHAETFRAWEKDLTYKAATLWLTGTSGGGMFLDDNGDGITDDNGDTIICNAYNNPLPIAAESMRLIVTDSQNSDGYVEIGRLLAGEYYEAENSDNISERLSFDYRERSELIETRGGQFRAMERSPQRVIGVEYEWLNADDVDEIAYDSLTEYLRTVGQRGDVLISVFPGEGTDRERKNTVVGRITNRSPIGGHFTTVTNGEPTLWSRINIAVTEVL